MDKPSRSLTIPWRSWVFIWIRSQVLLVPESVLLVVLLCLHIALGAPMATALLGLLLVGWFACRGGLLWLARLAIDEARYDHAAWLAQAALWMHPFSADTFATLSTIHVARNELPAGLAALQRAIAYYPGQAPLHAALSGALLENEQPQEAAHEARHALELDARCALAYLHLANVEYMQGAALEIVEQQVRMGLRAQPQAADEAALRCALTRVLIAQERQPEAQLILKGVEPLLVRCPTPQRAELHYHLGELRRTLGDPEIARHHFNTSETLDPHGRYAAAAWRAARS